MIEKRLKTFLFLFIVIGIILFSIGVFNDSIVYVSIGIFLSVAGFIGLVLVRAYYMMMREENVHETLKNNNALHLAVCDECGKENILEDVYCVKCGNRLGEKDGENI